MEGIAGLIFWVVFIIVVSIVKNVAKKADKQNKKTRVPPYKPKGNDPLQDFFGQLNDVSQSVKSATLEQKKNVDKKVSNAQSVEDFFNVTNKPAPKKKTSKVVRNRPGKKIQPVIKPAEAILSEKLEDKKNVYEYQSDSYNSNDYKKNAYDYKDTSSESSNAYSQNKKLKVIKLSPHNMSTDHKTDMKKMKQAVIWSEIIGKPKTLQNS